MPVRLRLQRKGRKKSPFYHIVAADHRAPRDGKYIERLGYYNPMTSPATIELDADAALKWLNHGAQPSDTVRAILKYRGVMYKKHLQRGVKKGSFSQEEADKKFIDFMEVKDKTILDHKERVKVAAEEKRRAIFGASPANVGSKKSEEE